MRMHPDFQLFIMEAIMKISVLKKQARATMQGNWGISILVMLVVMAISGVVDSVTGGLGIWVTPVLYVGVASFYLTMARNGSAPFETVFTDTFSNFLRKWGATLLTMLYTALWMLLFIIPGIVKSYSYAMTRYILLDNPELTADQAITKSREMMDGYKWKLFLLDLSFIGWHLLAGITCGLVYLYALPLLDAAKAQFYQELKQIKG